MARLTAPPTSVRWALVDDVLAWARSHQGWLDADERGRARRLRHGADRQSFLAAHVLARGVLGDLRGVDPAQVELDRRCGHCGSTDHGRPELPGGDVRFSLSRTASLVVLATSAAVIGVDVESTAAEAVVASVSPSLHPLEAAEVAAAGDDRRALFTRTWVRKEALLKALGTGLARSTEVDYVGTTRPDLLDPRWQVLDVEPVPGQHVGVCVSAGTGAVEVVRLTASRHGLTESDDSGLRRRSKLMSLTTPGLRTGRPTHFQEIQ